MKKPFALVVEDDPHLSKIFATVLQSHFDVEIVEDGNSASMRLAQLEPTIIVLDLNLPGMGGEEILINLRQDSRLRDTPVILCTADSRTAETLHEKADIVLLKPVSPMQLQQIAMRFIPAN